MLLTNDLRIGCKKTLMLLAVHLKCNIALWDTEFGSGYILFFFIPYMQKLAFLHSTLQIYKVRMPFQTFLLSLFSLSVSNQPCFYSVVPLFSATDSPGSIQKRTQHNWQTLNPVRQPQSPHPQSQPSHIF